MASALLESSHHAAAPQTQNRGTILDRPLGVEQLARAVGEHALRQAEIDQKMVTRILELRDDLSSAKEEIRALRAQVDHLIQGLSEGLAMAHSQSANTTQSAQQASVSSLRNR
jgi:DNA-binding ferritin-like protein